METIRLLFFTSLWTAVRAAPLPKLSRRVELVAGLIPFAAFGLRVLAASFLGVPEDDPVRRAVAPLVDWVNGVDGVLPYQWVLDVTVAIGLVWLASRWRLATIWVMPAVRRQVWRAFTSLAFRSSDGSRLGGDSGSRDRRAHLPVTGPSRERPSRPVWPAAEVRGDRTTAQLAEPIRHPREPSDGLDDAVRGIPRGLPFPQPAEYEQRRSPFREPMQDDQAPPRLPRSFRGLRPRSQLQSPAHRLVQEPLPAPYPGGS